MFKSNRFKLLFFLSGIATFSLYAQNPDWENPLVFARNQEPPHVPLVPYNSVEVALNDTPKNCSNFISLNGIWKFFWAETPQSSPISFFEENFDISEWDDIQIPSNWQMRGYGFPMFRNVSQPFHSDPPFVPHDFNPVGSYRRTFEVPPEWENKQIFLHFEGIKSASYVWINGKEVGYDQSGMEPVEYNITQFVRTGINHLAVKVIRFSDGTYLDDQDMWRLSGIFRNVYLFATPKVHLRDYSVITDLDEQYNNSTLKVQVEIKNYDTKWIRDYSLRLSLYNLDKRQVLNSSISKQTINLAANEHILIELKKQISNPLKWSAEKPNLYWLILELIDPNGQIIEVLSNKIGFREVEIVEGAILVNGIPIKFNGVNSHVHHPETGRVMDVETMKKDLQIMKRFNINCVRTSHYPPNPEYLYLADLYGIYVVDETGDEAHSNRHLSYNPMWREAYLDRVHGLVMRDRNHPSVIIWSAGNESGSGPNIASVIEEGKRLDPSRPGWLYGGNAGRLPFEDIIGPRYPDPWELKNIGEESPEIDSRPSFMDEYAAATGNSLGSLDEFWEVIYNFRRLTGGAVWDWVSPAIKLKLCLTPDFSILKNNGLLMGCCSLTEGKYGKAIALSGRDEWVEVYNHHQFDIPEGKLTLMAWVYPRGWHDCNPFITKGNHQYALQQLTRDSLEFYIQDVDRISLKTTVPQNWDFDWHHLAATYDGEFLRLYLNGDLRAEKAHRGKIDFSPYPVNIGKNAEIHGQDYPGQLSNALIDNVRIFKRSLASKEIQFEMESFESKSSEGAILWLNFDQIIEQGSFYSLGIGGRAYGLVWGDRSIQPELWQLKKSPQPVKIKPLDLSQGIFEITNRFHFTNLNELDAIWTVSADNDLLQQKKFYIDLPPGESKTIKIPFKVSHPDYGIKYWLLISLHLAENKIWAPRGHEVAWEQFLLPLKSKEGNKKQIKYPPLVVEEKTNEIVVSGKSFEYIFSKKEGFLHSISFNQIQFLKTGPHLNVWRAPINNETDQWRFQDATQWFQAGLDRLKHQLRKINLTNQSETEASIRVQTILTTPDKQAGFYGNYLYQIKGNGEITLTSEIIPQGKMPAWLPKIGLQMVLPPEFCNVQWYGRGPIETYPDRKTGAKVGIYSGKVSEQYVPYLVPQDYGNKTDVFWVALTNNRGMGLFIKGKNSLNVSVQEFTTDNLTRAQYPFQLIKQDDIILNIDHRVTGLGGTPVSPLYPYRTFPKKYVFTVKLVPFKTSDISAIRIGRENIFYE